MIQIWGQKPERLAIFLVIPILTTFLVKGIGGDWVKLWPSLVALLVVLASRSALTGLAVGAVCGSIQVAATLAHIFPEIVEVQILPILSSEWKLSAILFTLTLGGFVALLEKGGGLQAILSFLSGKESRQAKRLQMSVMGFGLFVFFDGLANSMLIGRIFRKAADSAGVSREKLAYLADTTGSAIACIAVISTWIAFQLSMIQDGLEIAGQQAHAYALFFRSIPANFYCWFALCVALVCILRNFNPGPMAIAERNARNSISDSDTPVTKESKWQWLFAVIPVAVLAFSIPIITYIVGTDSVLPFSVQKFASAYGIAEAEVPQILVTSSFMASFVAGFPVLRRFGLTETLRVFFGGIRELLGPVGILIAAWMLGAAIKELGAAEVITGMLNGRLGPEFFPAIVFVSGAIISFSTGTSWGTMAILMPLSIPAAFAFGLSPDEAEVLVVAAIAGVFSGAVFGDHCSPFSDTTIVSSIAAGVEPIDHVKTQFPFAVIAAAVAVVSFLGLGFGGPSWVCLLMGFTVIVFIPSLKLLRQTAWSG